MTFDLWQTLIFEVDGSATSHLRREARTGLTASELGRLGVDVEIDVIRDAFKTLSEEITGGHDHGFDQPYEDWISILVERLAPGLSERVGSDAVTEIGRLVDHTFIDSPPVLLDGSTEMLRDLAGRGLRIGLISNTGLTSPQTYEVWFKQLGIFEYFDFLAFSNGQSVAKPDPAIFRTTVTELGVIESHALHVGDNLHTDVAGAAAVGMSTVWVRGGISSPVETTVKPNYAVDSIREMPSVVDNWLTTL